MTDRNNIRKLLSLDNPGSTSHDFRGFGHEFEKAYTTSQISDSTAHHSIISYRFSDLYFTVRHERDEYVDAGTRVPSSNSKASETDSLSSMLGSLSLSPTSSPPNTTLTGSKLTFKEEGQVIPLESTVGIKTSVFHKRLEIQLCRTAALVISNFEAFASLQPQGYVSETRG